MAERPASRVEEYASLRRRHQALHRRDGAGQHQRRRRHRPAQMTRRWQSSCSASGLVEEEPTLEGLYDDSFTEDYIEREGG